MVKTLRFAVKQAEDLLRVDPKVKIIHLVRDPRGVLRSREVTRIGLQYHVTGEQLCSKVAQDVKVSGTPTTSLCVSVSVFVFFNDGSLKIVR